MTATTSGATDYYVAVLCEDDFFRVATICDSSATSCSWLDSLVSDEAKDAVQCSESHRIAVRLEQSNAVMQVGCEQLFALDCARLAAHGRVTLACNQPLYTMYEGALLRGSVIRHEITQDVVLLGVTLRTGQIAQIVCRLENCRFGTEALLSACDVRESVADDTSSDCSMKFAGTGTDSLLASESSEAASRLTAIRRDAPIVPRRKTVSESNTNEVMDDQAAAIVLTSLSASASAARHAALAIQRAAPASGQPIDVGGHVAGPLKRGVRQRCSNSLSEPYSASALRSRLAAAASQAQGPPEREREREAPFVRYPHHFSTAPAFLLVSQQRNEQSARVPLRLTPAPTESADGVANATYRGALFQPAIVQAVPIIGASASATAASISCSAPSTFGSSVPLQRPSVPFSATPRQVSSINPFSTARLTVGSGSSSPREASMPPCAPGANVSVVSRDEGIGADIEMDDSSCTTASASTSTIGPPSTMQANIIPYRFECTWRGCTIRTTTRHAIEQHIRDAHLTEEERGKNEEEFYYNEIDEHDDDDCTSESLTTDGDGSAERRRVRTADDLIDSVAAGFSSLIASSPPTAGAAVRPSPVNAASHSPFIGASASGPLVLPAALVAAPRNGTPRAPNANALGTSLSTMTNGPVKVLRSAPVSILSVTPSAVLTPPGGATPSSWSTSTTGVAAPLRFMNFYSYQLVPATPSSSWSPHSDRVQTGCAPVNVNFALATGRPPNGSPQSAAPNSATTPAAAAAAATAIATTPTSAPAPANDYDSEQAGDDAGGSGSASRRSKSDVKKCRKVYGIENRDKWCLQCKWKKACTRFPD